MNDLKQTNNGFEHEKTRDLESSEIETLLDGALVLDDLSDDDLREMAKFEETPNLYGLEAHRATLPAPDAWHQRLATLEVNRKDASPLAAPTPVLRALTRALRRQPLLHVNGALAGAGGAFFVVECWLPQAKAHLLKALRRMLWPSEHAAHLQVCLMAEPLTGPREKIFAPQWWSDPRQTRMLLTGCDDFAFLVDLLWQTAKAHWRSGGHPIEPREAGEGYLQTDDCHEAEWVALDGDASPAQRAAAEVWLVEYSRFIAPVWQTPPLKATQALADPVWREACLAPGALLFGDLVDHNGRILGDPDFAPDPGTTPEGLCLIPRESLPSPALNEAEGFTLPEGERRY